MTANHPKKIIHIINNEKFISEFYKLFSNKYFKQEHLFIYLYGESESNFPIPESEHVVNICNKFNGIKNLLKLNKVLIPYFSQADEVVIHGLFTDDIIRFLFLNKRFLKKCHWVMWGGDLYAPLLQKKTFRNIINQTLAKKIKGNFAGYITYLAGDFDLAKKLYGAKGKHHECLMYPSNLYKELKLPEVNNNYKTVLVGNSADPSNNHEETLAKLSQLANQNFKIICPLSYGIKEHAEKIAALGQSFFGERFVPLMNFMVFNEYLNILAQVDIAIFAHNRQQAMGNTISLLGLGKTVYMRNDVTPFAFFKSLDIKVLDFNHLNLSTLDVQTINKNKENVKNYFSEKKIIKQLKELFE